MKAIVYRQYGPPDVLELREVEQPAVADDAVLVRVRAASVNPLDWHGMTGLPLIARMGGGLRRPANDRLGADFAGVVEAVGSAVTRFRPGDEVYGASTGAFAEFVSAREDRTIAKPANLSFEQAAAVPVAALTALQGLRDQGRIVAGHKVLINGASGGVGTFAVQLAKSFDAEVTGVCRTGNVELVRSLGADHVIDYTREDFTRGGRKYDLILDIAGGKSWPALRRVLRTRARVVIVGGPKTNRLLGPLGGVVALWLGSRFGGHKVGFFIAQMNQADLEFLNGLLLAGTIAPVIDRTYPLREIADALAYLGAGHARAKVVVTV